MIGLGTQLDTARFRSLIAEALEAAADAGHGHDPRRARRQHGPDLVGRAGRRACRWRSSPAGPPRTAEALFARTKGSGAEVIKLKGGAGFAVGLSIREVVHAVALDSQADPAGLVARQRRPTASATSASRSRRSSAARGVEAQLEIELWPKEVSALQHSGQVLRETIDQVLKKNPKAAGKAVAGPAGDGRAEGRGQRPVRVTMGSGGTGNGSAAASRVTISGRQRQRRGGRG